MTTRPSRSDRRARMPQIAGVPAESGFYLMELPGGGHPAPVQQVDDLALTVDLEGSVLAWRAGHTIYLTQAEAVALARALEGAHPVLDWVRFRRVPPAEGARLARR